MEDKPAFIRDFNKPRGTEIKHINGHWYLYQRLTKYDPETRRSHKVSGPLLGTITEGGFMAKKPKDKKITNIFQSKLFQPSGQ